MGHRFRRHPHHRLAGSDQIAFQTSGQVPAVLERPEPLGVERAGPFINRGWSCVVVPTVFVGVR